MRINAVFWPQQQQQIRIEGTCSKVDEATSEEYFQSRPWASKIGAWASNQSSSLTNRTELEKQFEKFAKQFPTEVPRPKHWGGYAINPTKIEFWQGRPSRLHDRILYTKRTNDWSIERLNP